MVEVDIDPLRALVLKVANGIVSGTILFTFFIPLASRVNVFSSGRRLIQPQTPRIGGSLSPFLRFMCLVMLYANL